MLRQQHKKDPSHSAKSAGGRLHVQLKTHAPYVCAPTKWHYTLVHGYMVFTEHALRRQQFQMAPAK